MSVFPSYRSPYLVSRLLPLLLLASVANAVAIALRQTLSDSISVGSQRTYTLDVPSNYSSLYFQIFVTSNGGIPNGNDLALDLTANGGGTVSNVIKTKNGNNLGLTVYPLTAAQYTLAASLSGSPVTLNYSITPFTFCNQTSYAAYQVNSTSQFTCTPCPANSEAKSIHSTSADHCICSLGYFSSSGAPPCQPCPYGGSCSNPGTNASTLLPKAGYFKLSPTSADTLRLVGCPYEFACVNDGQSCAIGYTGLLCRECAKGYYRIGAECHPCYQNSVLPFVFSAIVFYIALHALYHFAPLLSHYPTVAIFIDFCQVLAIYRLYKFRWDDVYMTLYRWLSLLTVNWELSQVECGLSDAIPMKWIFGTIEFTLPFAFIGVYLTRFAFLGFLRLIINSSLLDQSTLWTQWNCKPQHELFISFDKRNTNF
ncbi:hypothetical protein BKA69DRAFT_1074372 [Paraphysoderma sedebokerense]|nr:hypothetical protein BKA69DRAFT_1074372 [Paraphysoderma sedebokerense]